MSAKPTEGPAIGMIVAAGLDAAFAVFLLLANIIVGLTLNHAFHMPRTSFGTEETETLLSAVFGLLIPILALIIDGVIIYGAFRMKKTASYSWALAAAILSLIPCLSSPCFVLGIPFGIWALMVLLDPEVRPLFDRVPPEIPNR